jgi:hypothetical protein
MLHLQLASDLSWSVSIRMTCFRDAYPSSFRGFGLRARAHLCSCASDDQYLSLTRFLSISRLEGGDTTYSMVLGKREADLFPLTQL